MALNVKELATKDIAGFPVWVWGLGIVGGLYLSSKVFSGGGGTGTTTTPVQNLLTGNTSDTGVPGCPLINTQMCNAGETLTFTTGPDGCPVPSCQPTGNGTGDGGTGDGGTTNATCYTVVTGDSLSRIAQREGTPGGWPQLQQWNSAANACSSTGYASLLVNPNLILPGWKLRVL